MVDQTRPAPTAVELPRDRVDGYCVSRACLERTFKLWAVTRPNGRTRTVRACCRECALTAGLR